MPAMSPKAWPTHHRTVAVAPSLLAADVGNLRAAVQAVEASGVDRLHIDIMDGVFVPNYSFGTDTVRMLREATELPLELHLMVVNPDAHLTMLEAAGADAITVHAETCPHLHRTVASIRHLGMRPGVAINPATPVAHISDILDAIDLALVMTIDPGFGGQELIPHTLKKISALRQEIDERNLAVEIEVDGGVDLVTAPQCVAAGATVLVAGTAIFGADDPATAASALCAFANMSHPPASPPTHSR